MFCHLKNSLDSNFMKCSVLCSPRFMCSYLLIRSCFFIPHSQIVSSASTDLQDYTYYFVPAPWLSCKLLRLLQCYPPPEDGAVKGRLVECLETILNKAQEPPKSKKVQHSNAKNAILFEAISLIIHYDRCKLPPFLFFTPLKNAQIILGTIFVHMDS